MGERRTARVATLAAALLVLAAAGSAARAQDAGDSAHALLGRAVATYAQALETADRDRRLEQFRSAARLFRALGENGVESPELYTNLGNASLQGERLGDAVLAYRRALLLDPDHPRALQNLDHARRLLPDWVPTPEPAGLLDSFFFWHRTLPRADRALAAAVCFLVAAILVGLGIRAGQTGLRNAALLPALVWIGLLASVALDPAAAARNEAVVIVPEVVARSADSKLAPTAFPQPLPGGVELTIVEERAPWLRVRLANGRDAWITAASVGRVRP